jgi:gas vesicle protein
MSNKDSSLMTFMLGALIGAAVAILYAPQSGKDTRKHLKRLSEDLADSVEEISEEIKDTGRKFYDEGRERVISEAVNAKEKLSKKFDKKIAELEEDI